MDLGLLILRFVVGLTLAAHGAQKLLGWFGGYGLDGTGQFMETLGFYPGRRHAALAGLTEARCAARLFVRGNSLGHRCDRRGHSRCPGAARATTPVRRGRPREHRSLRT